MELAGDTGAWGCGVRPIRSLSSGFLGWLQRQSTLSPTPQDSQTSKMNVCAKTVVSLGLFY